MEEAGWAAKMGRGEAFPSYLGSCSAAATPPLDRTAGPSSMLARRERRRQKKKRAKAITMAITPPAAPPAMAPMLLLLPLLLLLLPLAALEPAAGTAWAVLAGELAKDAPDALPPPCEYGAAGVAVTTPLVPGWLMAGSVVMLISHAHTHTHTPSATNKSPGSGPMQGV